MGLFDYYEPVPELTCPVCAQPLDGWQGKSADNLLFVWRQNESAPIDWRADPAVQDPEMMRSARLPSEFGLTAFDASDHAVVATGAAPDGVWLTTTIDAVLQQRVSRKGADFTRVLWGSAPWLSRARRDR
jgi:hypothetical protein